MLLAIVTAVGGLLLLTLGAESLVRGASSLAAAARIPPLVVGLTIVAFGTSAPELVVSLRSALAGSPDIALGNVVGSNILNVVVILGASAAITPLRVSAQLVRFDVPLMVGLSVLVGLLAWDGRIGRADGLLLAGGLLAYIGWSIWKSRGESADVVAEYETEFGFPTKSRSLPGMALDLVMLVGGLGLLILGSRWFTESAVTIARTVGFSELVIGLTIVAAGTSLPELATSLLAAVRGERDIAVGNVVGSNLFNILGVLGISAVVAGEGIPVPVSALRLDIPVMIAVAVACLPIFFTGHLIARWEGALFLAYFVAYTTYLVLDATDARVTRTFATIMVGFVLPLTVVTLGVTVVRAVRSSRSPA